MAWSKLEWKSMITVVAELLDGGEKVIFNCSGWSRTGEEVRGIHISIELAIKVKKRMIAKTLLIAAAGVEPAIEGLSNA